MLKEFVDKNDIKNALLGTIIADGHISKKRTKNANCNLEITHTSKNLDYLKELKYLIESVDGIKCTIQEHNKNSENKKYFLYRLTTSRNKYFTDLRNFLYKNNIKEFPKEIIDKFNDLSLFLLYLDDGTLRVRYKEGTSKLREARISFCLDSFTYEEMKYFQKWLLDKYNIKTGIYRHSKNMELNRGFRIWTNTENTKKLMILFDKYYNQIPSMNYKFLKYYSL